MFKTLDEEYSKKLLRFIFPCLFNFRFLISTGMFLFFALAEFIFGMVAGIIIAIGFFYYTYHLTPRINKMWDLMIIAIPAKKKNLRDFIFPLFFYTYSVWPQ